VVVDVDPRYHLENFPNESGKRRRKRCGKVAFVADDTVLGLVTDIGNGLDLHTMRALVVCFWGARRVLQRQGRPIERNVLPH
jgi:hypothetical protein